MISATRQTRAVFAAVLLLLPLNALNAADPPKPVKVFILAGQSNMEGQAVVDLAGKDYNNGRGTLAALMRDPVKGGMYKHLKDANGKWSVRNDVWVRYQREHGPLLAGPLGLGFSVYGDQHHFGPELQFGHVVGAALTNPVMLIKTAWGGKSLYKDFRPPSSGGKVGEYYKLMIAQVHESLANMEKEFPPTKGCGYELAGFVWYHGWNDGCEPMTAVPEYEQNLVNLIRDVRKEFNVPKLPVVIGELTGPWVKAPGTWNTLRQAQAAAAARPEFALSVAFVPTHDFVRKAEDSPNPGHGHHEFGNAETYFLVGNALGDAMKKLITADLDLGSMAQRVPKEAMFAEPGYFVWCGAPTKGADGKYHLYYSRWPVTKGFAPGWAIWSEIAYAKADHAQGPYRFVNVALPARGVNPATGEKYWDADVTHNPNILQHRGKYYLFYMGNHGDGAYAVHRNNQRIGLAVADKPEGPWRRFDRPIVDVSADKAAFDSLCVTNPAAAVRPDGGVLLIYKAVEYVQGKPMGGKVRFGAALADKPEGPYTKKPGRIFDAEDDTGKTWMLAEDPFIWYSTRFGNRYYAVSRDVIGKFTGTAGGIALFQSADGLRWEPAPHSKVLGNRFRWADGTLSGDKIERPALLFDGETPLALFGATDGYEKNGRVSFNVHIPLAQ